MIRAVVTRTVTVSEYEWALISRRAESRDQTIERYLIDRALSADVPLTGSDEDHPLVLTPDQQRELANRISRLDETVLAGFEPSDPWAFALGNRVAVIFEATMLEMLRTGRYHQLVQLLADTFGKGRAARIAREFRARALDRGWLQPDAAGPRESQTRT